MSTEQILEFDQMKKCLAKYAYTEKAKQEAMQIEPFYSELELTAALRETTEAVLLLNKGGNPPLLTLLGVRELFALASKGACLSAEEIEQIGNTLTDIKRLKEYLERCQQFECGLAYYAQNLEPLQSLREEIFVTIRNEKVEDSATKLLRNLRNDIIVKESKMREKADAVIRSNKEAMSDSYSTLRNGHLCVPVKKEYRSRIDGSVIGQSSTGSTIFIEPAGVGRFYTELEELRIEEENETRRILYTLTAMIGEEIVTMEQNAEYIEKLDFAFAKGKLSISYQGICPTMNTSRHIRLVDGRHPLMDPKTNVPLQFAIGNGINGVVITGPNTGGKTVAIKTVALNSYMAQCGLHVAAREADICMNSAILCDIGDGQNISENLSTFSAHIKNVLDILAKADHNSLVIMDELGSGTDPTEGMGIAIAILRQLKKSGALYLVTTHYPEVKIYAENEEGVINARMTFDKESLCPLYQMVIGEAGESCAFHIAARLGMPDEMLRCAMKEAYGERVPQHLCRLSGSEGLHKENGRKIQAKKESHKNTELTKKLHRGDSVMIYPDKKIGIVAQGINDKGILQVQLPNKKIYINHKRVKLLVQATEMYPEDYDFSIVFDSVENRKMRHAMERKYVENDILEISEDDL